MATRIEIKRDNNNRIAAEVYRNGRLWRTFTSNGERPFESTGEAKSYAIKRARNIPKG